MCWWQVELRSAIERQAEVGHSPAALDAALAYGGVGSSPAAHDATLVAALSAYSGGGSSPSVARAAPAPSREMRDSSRTAPIVVAAPIKRDRWDAEGLPDPSAKRPLAALSKEASAKRKEKNAARHAGHARRKEANAAVEKKARVEAAETEEAAADQVAKGETEEAASSTSNAPDNPASNRRATSGAPATRQSTRQTRHTTAGMVISSDPSAPKRKSRSRSFCGPAEQVAVRNNALDVMEVDTLDELQACDDRHEQRDEEKMRTLEEQQQRGKERNGCEGGCGCLAPGSFLPPGVEEQGEQARGFTAMQCVGETVAGPERGGAAPAQATQSGERGGRGGRPEARDGGVGPEENAVGVTASDATRSNGRSTSKKKPIQTTQNTVCKCKKSSCLKKYCACFRAGSVCGAKCKCANCKNAPAHPAPEDALEEEGEVWEVKAVLSELQITHPDAKECATDGCSLKACAVWVSNLDMENPSFSCLDCGPWPEKVPIKVLTDVHKQAIIAKCSSIANPPLPDLPCRLVGVSINNVAGGTFHEVCITNHGPLGVGSCPEENWRVTRIVSVTPNSQADQAGLRPGDVPVSNGRTIPFHTFQQLCQIRPFVISVLSGGHVISHGGGKRCSFKDCEKHARSGGDYCISHGGGKRCSFKDCEKQVLSGGLCGTHGGGKRCSVEDCEKQVLSGGLCGTHGGGKRCSVEDCEKHAQSGGLCGTHGGGKRCSVEECEKHAQSGRDGYCAGHFNLIDLAGDATKMDLLVESVSQLLPTLGLETGASSDSIQSIAKIYSEGCKGMLSGHVIAQQILKGVTLGETSALPCSQRFCGYTETRAVGKKRTLVLIYIRVSPKTRNNGHTQIIRIVVAIYLLQVLSSTEIYEVYPIIFAGMEVDRRESFESDGVHRLFDTLLRIPEDTNVLVVANEALRVSSESHQVKTFENTVEALHLGAKCVFLDQLGLDREAGTAALIERLAEINEVATHNNPGKSVPIDEDYEKERESVEERASRICEDIASFEAVLTNAAAAGIERPMEGGIARSWRNACNRVRSTAPELQDEAIQREAANFVSLGNDGKRDTIAFYSRRSPGVQGSAMSYGLPQWQSAMNLAFAERKFSADFGKRLIAFHDEGCPRDALCNNQFAKLLAAIIRGELHSVIFAEPNRPTSHLLHFKLLHAVCKLKGTQIWYSKCIGQDEFAIAQAEEDRNAEMAAAWEEYNALIEDLRKAIADEDLRALSYAFKKLSGMRAFPGIDPPKEWD